MTGGYVSTNDQRISRVGKCFANRSGLDHINRDQLLGTCARKSAEYMALYVVRIRTVVVDLLGNVFFVR